jgi:hypothetical protein
MPSRIKIVLGLLISLLALPALRAYEPSTTEESRPFRFETNTFAFANETVWNYANGSVQTESSQTPEQKKRDYTRRCFVVSRAAVQFWKFARFEPKAAPLPADQLATRIREVTERSVWLPALSDSERVVFPGYRNLREMSAASPGIFQANIGLGWPIYFRAGMMPIIAPVFREIEAQLNREIFHDLQNNDPTVVWLYNFPSLNMNHAVVVFAGQREHDRFVYRVYDPNYAKEPKKLEYDITTRTFSYEPTFYFKGGSVEARAVYRGVLQ